MHRSSLIPLHTGLFRSTVLRLALLLMTGLGIHSTQAATRIWSGGHASSANWNLRDNWGGVAVPVNGDTLVFPSGAARIVNTNNIAGMRLHQIQFLGLGGGYSLRGNSVSVTNGLSLPADAANAISLASIAFQGEQAISVSAGGVLTVNSDLVLNGSILYLQTFGDLTLSGAISGQGQLVKLGNGLLTFSGPQDNTFTGTVTINGGMLAMNKRETISIVPLVQVSRIAVPGNLAVGNGANAATVRLNFDDQIANTSTVTVAESSTLEFNGNHDAFNNLVLRGGAVTMGVGTLILNGDIASQASDTASTISGQIMLNSASTFTVADGPANNDLEIAARIGSSGGWGFTKSGPGTLRLGGTNIYSGATFINEGLVRAASDSPFGAANNGTTIAAGAELFIEPTVDTLREPLTIAGAGIGGTSGAIRLGSGATIATNIVLSAPATINTMGGGSLTIDGVISGTGPFTKIGPGTLTLGGSAVNTFSGYLVAEAGLLQLSKLAGSAVQGDLIIGTTNTTAIARHTRSANLGGAVTVNSESLYDLNGNNESIDALTLYGGGDVQTGTGQLTLNGDVVYTVNTGLPKPSIVEGRLHVDIGERHFVVGGDNEDHVVRNDLVIRAHVTGSANIVKSGSGNLGLSASNSFTGTLTVEGGDLSFGDAHSLGTSGNQTILTGNSSIRIYTGLDAGDGIIVDEPLFLNTSRQAGGGFFNYGSNIWSGSIFLGQTAVVNVTTNSTLNISGVINGLAGLTKTGLGLLLYSGTALNTYIGATRVNEGTLRLERTGGANRSIPGTLIVGDGLGGPDADVVEVAGGETQISNLAAVVVNGSGLLVITDNLFAEGIGSLSGSGRVELAGGIGGSLQVGLNGDSTLFEGVISGSGRLWKHGAGTFTLNGANTYTGDTDIAEGTLVVNGFQASSDVYVEVGATLKGIGNVGELSIGGTLDPGDLFGEFGAQTVNFLPGSTMIERIDGPPQSGAFTPYGNNWFRSQGVLDVTGATLDVTLGFPPSQGQEFFIGRKSGAALPSGTFVGKPEGSIIVLNQIPFHLSYQGGSGNDITLTVGELVLRLDSVRVEAGNGNGRIEPDECNDLFVSIENPTAAGVTVLDAHLQSLDNRIVVTQGETVYGVVPASGVRTNRAAFQIRTAPNYPCGENAVFHLVLSTVGHGRFAIPITLPTGTPGSYREFPNPAGPAIIPDAGALSSQVVVATPFKVGKARVSLHATHPSAGQLRFKLISPQGVEVLLAEGEGGAGNNYGQDCDRRTTFDDAALVSITTADAPFSGRFAPEGNLRDFVGLDSAGIWTLLAEDTVAGGLGALQCWTLELAPAECAPGGGGCASCLTTVNGALDAGQTMPERLLGGYPSGCGDAADCPGVTSIWESPYRYATHSFTNTGLDACVAVMLTVPCMEANKGLTASAYLGDFNPGNLCANFLGHSGYQVEKGSGGFSFRVPAGERFTVVVNERNIYEDFQGCDTYALQVFGLPCPQEQPRLHIANDAGPDNVRLHWSTAYPGFQLQGTPNLGGVALWAFTNMTTTPTVVGGHYSVTNNHSLTNHGFFRLRKP